MRGSCYRELKGQAYTREEYIGGAPQPKVVKFVMGTQRPYQYRLKLVSTERAQIRHNALEAARVAVNKPLQEALGEANYLFRIKVYPFHILRENKMMAFAGADRLQEGMRRAFGKPVGRAARVSQGTVIMEVEVDERGIEAAKRALKLGAHKLPVPCRIEIEKLS